MNRFPVLSLPAALAVSVAMAASASADHGPLVTPLELSQISDGELPVVIDIRGDAYAEGHIPGAVKAPYAQFRGPDENPGQTPDPARLEIVYETLGLEPDLPVVIAHQGSDSTDFGAAARVYWTLKSSGFTDISILNGGTAAWQAAGLPLETAESSRFSTDLDIVWSDDWTAETDEVTRIVEGEEKALLVDARPAPFFEGREQHGGARRPGTLPGAQNFSHEAWFPAGSPLLSTSPDVERVRETLGLTGSEPVVSFCNTGHWAATNWFVLSELGGLDGVKLYPGSMVEYSQTGEPMENVPGLLRNLLAQIGG